MSLLRYIDWEMLGTVAMVFSAENALEIIFHSIISGRIEEAAIIELIGWLVLFAIITYETAEEAEENK